MEQVQSWGDYYKIPELTQKFLNSTASPAEQVLLTELTYSLFDYDEAVRMNAAYDQF